MAKRKRIVLRKYFDHPDQEKRYFAVVAVVLLGCFLQTLFAGQRIYIPKYSQIRDADTVVRGNVYERYSPPPIVEPIGARGFRITSIMVRYLGIQPDEVLKGDPALVGEQIPLSRQYSRASIPPDLGPGEKVIFLKKEADNSWNEVGAYEPDLTPKIRCLLSILEEKSEPDRVRKLLHLLREPSSVCPQVLWDPPTDESKGSSPVMQSMFEPGNLEALNIDVLDGIRGVRDLASFDVMAEEIDNIPSVQKTLLQWMIDTGDSRAVPVLIRMLDSEDASVAGFAAQGLRRCFPGAPGVTEAFEKQWKTANEKVRLQAIRYLMKRDSSQELTKAYRELPQPETYSMKAWKVFEEGPPDEARKICLQVLQDDTLNEYTRASLADCFKTALNVQDQDRHAPELASFLEGLVRGENVVVPASAVKLMASFRHPAMRQPLLSYLNRELTVTTKAEDLYDALMALKELGEESRAMGAGVLLKKLEETRAESINQSVRFIDGSKWQDQYKRLIALSWVGNRSELDSARQIILGRNSYSYIRNYAEHMQPPAEIPDEGAYWIGMVESQISSLKADDENRSILFNNEPEWFLMRLGYLQEERSIPLLLDLLKEKRPWWIGPVSRTLVLIGDSGTSGLKSFIGDAPDLSDYRESLSVLFEAQKDAALPFFRQLVKARTTDLPAEVWICFNKYGAAEDIALLAPLDDYWKYGINSFLRDALAAMRERHGYDLNGPIEKAAF